MKMVRIDEDLPVQSIADSITLRTLIIYGDLIEINPRASRDDLCLAAHELARQDFYDLMPNRHLQEIGNA